MNHTYELQVHTPRGWEQLEGTEASSRPHHYDVLRAEFDRLVAGAKPYEPYLVPGFGYRITQNGRKCDEWRTK